MEKPRKTLRQVAENPRQVKGTSEPEREGSQAKGTQKATKRPEDHPNRKGNSRGRKGPRKQRATRIKDSQRRNCGEKGQQDESRKIPRKRKLTDHNKATQRRGAQRPTMKPTQGTSGKNRHRTREPSGRNRNQKLSDPSIEIKGKRKHT